MRCFLDEIPKIIFFRLRGPAVKFREILIGAFGNHNGMDFSLWGNIMKGEAIFIFAKIVAQAAHRQNAEIGEKKLARLERRFSDVPMAIAIGAEFVPDCAIPRAEQEYSVAAGAMNILNALSFSGFGGVWVSGAYGEDAQLRKELGLSEDHEKGGLLGFLLVGSVPERVSGLGPKKRPALEDHVLEWAKA
ncbi:oxidoreductase [Lasius niger]|uniref:Oxidoreductase n=1 Tax=Lasius niger TaxID=67767 RepID=A0A0J7K3T3_LASNI|nr:oxidoreductase [Lasius niger]